jgi:UDP-N-acetylmuramate dehydrogenase
MEILQNISLNPYNTFGIDVSAKALASFTTVDELSELLFAKPSTEEMLVLGGGSNVLFTQDYNGWILLNRIPGISLVREDDDFVYVQVGAGVNWHVFVMYCIENGWGGVENLSLIPGCVGASPMQNIGAYGVEIKDAFESLEAWSIHDKTSNSFSNADCRFGYRESVFKRTLKDKFIITGVTFRLHKKPVFNTSYGAIEQELHAMGVQELNIKVISDAIIRIRQSKLPDPAVTGNAGSFFKNPEITTTHYEQLKISFPLIPGYPTHPGIMKVPAGWLIEQAGWKGFREGDAGVHPKQALVLVNYANANGAEVYALSEKIIQSVLDKHGICLEREVNIY